MAWASVLAVYASWLRDPKIFIAPRRQERQVRNLFSFAPFVFPIVLSLSKDAAKFRFRIFLLLCALCGNLLFLIILRDHKRKSMLFGMRDRKRPAADAQLLCEFRGFIAQDDFRFAA